LVLTNSEFNSIHFGEEIKKKKFLGLKNFGTHKIFFLIPTPKCIELNSESVRPKKICVFGLGLGLGPDPKPNLNTQVFFSNYSSVFQKMHPL